MRIVPVTAGLASIGFNSGIESLYLENPGEILEDRTEQTTYSTPLCLAH
jgi:hypothetical protein